MLETAYSLNWSKLVTWKSWLTTPWSKISGNRKIPISSLNNLFVVCSRNIPSSTDSKRKTLTALVCRRGLMNDGCTGCSGTREKRGPRGSPEETGNQRQAAAGNRSCVSGMRWHPLTENRMMIKEYDKYVAYCGLVPVAPLLNVRAHTKSFCPHSISCVKNKWWKGLWLQMRLTKQILVRNTY